MAYQNIQVETRDKVGLITLDRPAALNALNSELIAELSAALDTFEADAAIGAMVITGSERAFAAGADIKEMQSKTYMDAYFGDFIAPWERVSHCRKPVIAAVAGFALGGGCELAMMCDILIAAENAKFGQPEIKLAVFAPAASCLLPELVGQARAVDMLLSGRSLDAEEAAAIGLVTAVAADPEAAALKYFDRYLAPLSTSSLRYATAAARRGFAERVRSKLEALEVMYLEELMKTHDAVAGLESFIGKRPAQWKNR